ncbi:hypothetical protein ACFLQ4_00455 [Bacteroidota bacterium]
MISLAGKLRGVDLTKLKISSPVSKLLKMNVGDALLINLYHDKRHLNQAVEDFRKLDLTEKQKAMLEFAEKLTLYPGKMEEDDVKSLRENGFSDEEILSITLITNYFNFVNRVANALGVDFSEEEIKGYKY